MVSEKNVDYQNCRRSWYRFSETKIGASIVIVITNLCKYSFNLYLIINTHKYSISCCIHKCLHWFYFSVRMFWHWWFIDERKGWRNFCFCLFYFRRPVVAVSGYWNFSDLRRFRMQWIYVVANMKLQLATVTKGKVSSILSGEGLGYSKAQRFFQTKFYPNKKWCFEFRYVWFRWNWGDRRISPVNGLPPCNKSCSKVIVRYAIHWCLLFYSCFLFYYIANFFDVLFVVELCLKLIVNVKYY